MLELILKATELFDPDTNEFQTTKERHVTLEHSLVSISKWESKWKKPYLADTEKTDDELLDYIRCMVVSNKLRDDIIKYLDTEHIEQIQAYVADKMTATTINTKEKKNKQVITSELIYYWMIAANIPIECEKWHLNRLLMLINICSIKNADPKKMSKRDVMKQNKSLNEQRKKAIKTKG
jgi:hypothetical protein